MQNAARQRVRKPPIATGEIGGIRRRVVIIWPEVTSVTVTLMTEPDGVTLLGLTAQVAEAGAPEHDNAMAWLNPASGVTLSCRSAALPAVTVAVDVVRPREKSWAVPDNAMD